MVNYRIVTDPHSMQALSHTFSVTSCGSAIIAWLPFMTEGVKLLSAILAVIAGILSILTHVRAKRKK